MKLGRKVKIGDEEVYLFYQSTRKVIYFSFISSLILFVILSFTQETTLRNFMLIPYIVFLILILIDCHNENKNFTLRMEKNIRNSIWYKLK
jgi:hypothetical protein